MRRCSICHHPEREAIDQAFLHWQRPSAIAHKFNLNDRRIVYRHAHALDLFRKRASQSRRVLEFIMEQAETVTATADSVIRAVRLHSCIGKDGRWAEPPKRVIITHEIALPASRRLAPPAFDQAASSSSTQNGQSTQKEVDLIDTDASLIDTRAEQKSP